MRDTNVRVKCPSCHEVLFVRISDEESVVTCPGCSNQLSVPPATRVLNSPATGALLTLSVALFAVGSLFVFGLGLYLLWSSVADTATPDVAKVRASPAFDDDSVASSIDVPPSPSPHGLNSQAKESQGNQPEAAVDQANTPEVKISTEMAGQQPSENAKPAVVQPAIHKPTLIPVIKTREPLDLSVRAPCGETEWCHEVTITYRHGETSNQINADMFFRNEFTAAGDPSVANSPVGSVTGFGIPGRRIIVPAGLAKSDAELFVERDGERYRAAFAKSQPSSGFAVLNYDGPDFPRPRVSPYDECATMHTALRLNAIGQVNLVLNYPNCAKSIQRSFGPHVKMTFWGTLCGLGDREGQSIPMVDVVDHFQAKDSLFDFDDNGDTIDPNLNVDAVRENLVRVASTQDAQVKPVSAIHYELLHHDAIGFRVAGFTWNFKDVRARRPIDQAPLANMRLPFDATDMARLCFPSLESNQKVWGREDRVLCQTSPVLVQLKRLDAANTRQASAGEALLRSEFRVLQINRTERRAQVESQLRLRPLDASNYAFEITQTMEVDTQSGLLISSEFNGFHQFSSSSEPKRLNFSGKTRLLREAQAQKKRLAQTNMKQDANTAIVVDGNGNSTDTLQKMPTRRLTQGEIQKWSSALRSGAPLAASAIEELQQVIPDLDATLSKAFAELYGERFCSKAGDQVARRWILHEHVPLLVKSYAEDKSDRSPELLVEVLNRHATIDRSHDAILIKVFQKYRRFPGVAAAIAKRYAHLTESVYLESDLEDITAIEMLGEFGTQKSATAIGQKLKTIDNQKTSQDVYRRSRNLKVELQRAYDRLMSRGYSG